jgi:hypothetical protein
MWYSTLFTLKRRYALRYLKVSVPALMLVALLLNCKKSGTAPEKSDAEITTLINNAVKPPVGGIRIAWDYTTLKKVSPSNTSIRYAGYSRVIQLYDGSLICVFEADGHVAVVKSTDLGNTWSSQINVADPDNGINMSVPDILELADHSLLACYNPRPVVVDPARRFAIKTKKSYDGGSTWKDERTLYQADYKFENGCWEPSAIQLPSGEIQLYFANEGIYTNTDEQNISMVRSSDNGLTWSTTPQIVSFRAGKRDGMPCPLLLKNGNDIVFSIEDNGFSNFKPYTIRSAIKNNWQATVDANSPDRNYALADKIDDNIYAGAPYLRQLSTGETILSYQGTEGRTNNMDFAEMKVVIGDNSALNFNRKTVPFNISSNKSGLWNSISVLNDNTVIASTSTSSYSADNSTAIWMIKGHVIPELSAEKQTIAIDGVMNEPAWKTAFPVFIGHTSQTQATATVTYDDNALYVLAKVADSKVVAGLAAVESDDGISVYIDAANKSTEKPDHGIFKLCLSADDRLAVYQGNNTIWTMVNDLTTVRHNVKIAGAGYIVEMAIPWQALGAKPPLNSRIGFNMSLTENTGKTTADYTENISANEPDQPFSWCTLILK